MTPRERVMDPILSGLLRVVLKTAWLRQWHWSLLYASLNIFFGVIVGVLTFLHLMTVYGDGLVEEWTYTDPSAQVWECSRLVGDLYASCRRTEAGVMQFLYEAQPIFGPCTVRETRVR
jgi:hypothetical protein